MSTSDDCPCNGYGCAGCTDDSGKPLDPKSPFYATNVHDSVSVIDTESDFLKHLQADLAAAIARAEAAEKESEEWQQLADNGAIENDDLRASIEHLECELHSRGYSIDDGLRETVFAILTELERTHKATRVFADKAIAIEADLRTKLAGAERELREFKESIAFKGVTIQTDSPDAAMAELERHANHARDVSNRNAEIANANRSLREKTETKLAEAEADNASLKVAGAEALVATCSCVECDEPGVRYFRTEGDGPFWLCGSKDQKHAMPERYTGEEVEEGSRPLDALRAALSAPHPGDALLETVRLAEDFLSYIQRYGMEDDGSSDSVEARLGAVIDALRPWAGKP